MKLEEAITHKSAKTHAGNVFVPRDLDLLSLKQVGFHRGTFLCQVWLS